MRFVIAIVLSAGIVFVAGRWTLSTGTRTTKGQEVTQYKLDVPAPYRDAAVWSTDRNRNPP